MNIDSNHNEKNKKKQVHSKEKKLKSTPTKEPSLKRHKTSPHKTEKKVYKRIKVNNCALKLQKTINMEKAGLSSLRTYYSIAEPFEPPSFITEKANLVIEKPYETALVTKPQVLIEQNREIGLKPIKSEEIIDLTIELDHFDCRLHFAKTNEIIGESCEYLTQTAQIVEDGRDLLKITNPPETFFFVDLTLGARVLTEKELAMKVLPVLQTYYRYHEYKEKLDEALSKMRTLMPIIEQLGVRNETEMEIASQIETLGGDLVNDLCEISVRNFDFNAFINILVQMLEENTCAMKQEDVRWYLWKLFLQIEVGNLNGFVRDFVEQIRHEKKSLGSFSRNQLAMLTQQIKIYNQMFGGSNDNFMDAGVYYCLKIPHTFYTKKNLGRFLLVFDIL